MPSTGHFAGTAWFYARYRPNYPSALWELLTSEAGLDSRCRALDLGCGTGEIALHIARAADRVTAVDPDSDMLREGRRQACELRISNVTWVCSTAEAVALEPEFQLVTIGSALHWMDASFVLAKCHRMLSPKGFLAVISGPNPLLHVARRDDVGRAIASVQERWFGTQTPGPPTRVSSPAQVIAASALGTPMVRWIPSEQPWNVERLIGFLCSTSARPDQRLGDRFGDFVDDLSAALEAAVPSGEWTLHGHAQLVLAQRLGVFAEST